MTNTDPAAPGLVPFGNLPPAYVHEWRVARALDPIRLEGGVFKWYHVERESTPVKAAIDQEARSVLAAAAGGGWTLEYGLNFALLHQSTSQAFLIAGVWRGHQELWERIYFKDLAPDRPFTRADMTGEDSPAACFCHLPRADGVAPLPPLRPPGSRQAGLAGRHLRGPRLMESPGPAETGRRGADEHVPYSREYLDLVPHGRHRGHAEGRCGTEALEPAGLMNHPVSFQGTAKPHSPYSEPIRS